MPDIDTGLSPLDKFGRTVTNHSDLLDLYVWGCLAYVLDPALQDNQKLLKWNSQKHCGKFLGWYTNIDVDSAVQQDPSVSEGERDHPLPLISNDYYSIDSNDKNDDALPPLHCYPCQNTRWRQSACYADCPCVSHVTSFSTTADFHHATL
eukprot:15335579-Ditylum_brightwellii.AAC.1